MRKYVPKDNVQKKAYYTDRFHVVPRVPRTEVEEGSHFEDVVKTIGVDAFESYIEIGQLVLHINPEDNFKVMKTLKETCGYTQCSEQSAVDYLAKDNEFELFWQLLNITEAKRVRVVCRLANGSAIETIEPLFKSANFAEREMFDMFGIKVNNHPFLKRILMPDDWEGHPLLKTYPLHGDEFASWYEVDKIFGKEYRDIIGLKTEIREKSILKILNVSHVSVMKCHLGLSTMLMKKKLLNIVKHCWLTITKNHLIN